MASAWVGVVGTAIGAGIGGVVTVVSLVVKGRQDASAEQRRDAKENQHRLDDRQWAVRQQNLDSRRDRYAELLSGGAEVRAALGALMAAVFLSKEEGIWREERPSLTAALHELAIRSANVELIAVDREILDAVDAARQGAADTARTVRTSASTREEAIEILRTGRQRLEDDLARLRDVCRRDLGLDMPSAPPA